MNGRRMLPLLLLLLLLLQVFVPIAAQGERSSYTKSRNTDNNDNDWIVAGYLPDYRAYINLNNTAPFLTDVFLFSISPGPAGSIDGQCCLGEHHYQQAREARAFAEEYYPDQPPMNIWLSLGGAGRSNHFHQIVHSDSQRQNLALNLWKLCKKEGITGIDFDWEVPQTKDDFLHFMLLLEEIRDMFDANSIGSSIQLSVAVHPHQKVPRKLYRAIDRVHLMTYDMVQGGGHHAGMGKTQYAVQGLLDAGCPSSKIILGIPAYARHTKLFGNVKTVAEVFDGLQQKRQEEWTRLPDDGQYQSYAFDSPTMVQEKVQWAHDRGLAGVFFWEIGQDKQHPDIAPAGMLLQAAGEKLKSIQRQQEEVNEEL